MRGKTPDWTEKEDRLLKEYYGSMKLKELLHIFPDRTENAIRGRGKRLRKKGWSFDSTRRYIWEK